MGLSIIEQFAIVAQQGDYEFRTFIMYACLYALAAVGAVAIAWAILAGCKTVIEKVGRGTRVGFVVALLGVIGLVLYAGTKPIAHLWRFTFANGVHDLGSYCTNDTIHAEWDYAHAYEGYALRCAVRDLTITNEVGVCIDEWHYLEDAAVADMVAEWYVPDATNYEVTCYAQYVQPQHVVTNGVYHVGGVMRTLATTNSASPAFVTPGVSIYARIDGGEEIELNPNEEPPESLLGALLMEIENNNNQEE